MIEMTEAGGHYVTREWADAHTATEADARQYVGCADENIRRGYFPHGHATEAGFIRAKYQDLAAA